MSRIVSLIFAAAIGAMLAAALPVIPQTLRDLAGIGASAKAPTGHGTGDSHDDHGAEGKITIAADQLAAAGIDVVPVQAGVLMARRVIPGVLAANGDRLARVTGRTAGTVSEVRKRLGEAVAAGDMLAVIESRDVADAKGDYLSAIRATQLAATLLERETKLWKQRISPQQDYLQAEAAHRDARARQDIGEQRLLTLGLSPEEVAAVPQQSFASLRRLEVRAPISGRVIARAAVPGGGVSAETELFSVADLGTLWIELSIPPRDLPLVREGMTVTVVGEGSQERAATLIFLSPILDAETRSARAVAELPNTDNAWRPGAFVTARLTTDEQPVDVLVPRDAVQEIEGMKVVFVRTPTGFEMREIAVGREDDQSYEIIFGLDAGTEIAVTNTFSLRAELQKSEAEHAH